VIELAAKLKVESDQNALLDLLASPSADPAVRLAALRLLAGHAGRWRDPAIREALGSDNPTVRAAGRDILATVEPERAVASIESALNDPKSAVLERQQGFATLASLKSPEADALLGEWVKRLAAGRAAPEIQLDIIEAVSARDTPPFREALRLARAQRSDGDALAPYRPSLHGGDAER
jgi:hypothetical protein